MGLFDKQYSEITSFLDQKKSQGIVSELFHHSGTTGHLKKTGIWCWVRIPLWNSATRRTPPRLFCCG